jgi:hypothetical protein
MGNTWPRRILLAVAVVVTGAKGVRTEPAVLLKFISTEAKMAVTHAVAGATRRLEQPECQRVFADFSLAVPAAGQFAAVRFVDDPDAAKCRPGSHTLAFTEPGARVVHICGRRFEDVHRANPTLAEVIIVHELLHVLGLGEDPPTSAAITLQVATRCAP